MKRLMVLFLIFCFSVSVYAEDEKTVQEETGGEAGEEVIIYDVNAHLDNANDVFLGIGGVSMAAGLGMVVNGGSFVKGMGVENMAWGAVETGLALFEKNYGKRENDEEKARKNFLEISRSHFVLDLLITGGGLLVLIFGNEDVAGHGAGIAAQGLMLSFFDGINFLICDNPEKAAKMSE